MILKRFIQGVGFLVFLLGVISICFALYGVAASLFQHSWHGPLIYVMPMIILFYGVISWAGWRMFRGWNEATIQEFAFIQALLTGIAIGHFAHLWTNFYFFIGLVVFSFLARRLKRIYKWCLDKTDNYPVYGHEAHLLSSK